ncbi:MAG: PilZ domain-containing protein [Oscillospiraceae bacterium]|nr:PilZ domain-containing protein [Oscillospiraceae bacterium]
MGIFKKKDKAVSPLSADYLMSVCEIKTMENELMSTGKIEEITGEYIKIVKKTDSLKQLRTGARIKVNVFNTKKGFRVILGTVFTSTNDFMKIVEIVELADHDRRQFFRVNLELTAFVYEKGDLDTARKLPVNIRDMSLSGLRIEMDPPPEIGDVIWVELNLQGRAYCCQCRVMRRIPIGKAIEESFGKDLREDAKKAVDSGQTDFKPEQVREVEEAIAEEKDKLSIKNPGLNDNTKKDNQRYEYGCAFLFNENDDTDPLCNFLFKIQGEEIRRVRASEEKYAG